MTERGGGVRDPFGLGGKSGRSVNRGSSTNRDYSRGKYDNSKNRAVRPGTDRRHYAGSKSYGNDELKEIIKQRESRKNNGSMSNRRRSTDRGKSSNNIREKVEERKNIPSGS